jgi:hypothetical protein
MPDLRIAHASRRSSASPPVSKTRARPTRCDELLASSLGAADVAKGHSRPGRASRKSGHVSWEGRQ